VEELERLISSGAAVNLSSQGQSLSSLTALGHRADSTSASSSRPASSRHSIAPSTLGNNRGAGGGGKLLGSPDFGGSEGFAAGATSSTRRPLAPQLDNGENQQQAATAAIINTIMADKTAKDREILSLKSRNAESDFEVKRLSEQLKLARMQASELSDRVILIQSERDFYKIKWGDACPAESKGLQRAVTKSAAEFLAALSIAENIDNKVVGPNNDGSSGTGAGSGSSSGNNDENCPPSNEEGEEAAKEMGKVTGIIGGYLTEIENLKKQLAEHKQLSTLPSGIIDVFDEGELGLESELTTSVVRVIAQTEQHLLEEARRLKGLMTGSGGGVGGVNSIMGDPAMILDAAAGDSDEEGSSGLSGGEASQLGNRETQIEVDESAFQRRQKIMTREVSELGESIQLKEQLVDQLRRSHYQYGVMKAFYEQKLQALNEEMATKESERESLMTELQELELTKSETDAIKQKADRQSKLRSELTKRDEELRTLKKRQDELSKMSQVQSKYQNQMLKLGSEIEAMKKQRVDLTKSIQGEKKRHLVALAEKAKEIEALKKALTKSVNEARKLGKDKERAEEKAKEVRFFVDSFACSVLYLQNLIILNKIS
jgi:hypothetical protein